LAALTASAALIGSLPASAPAASHKKHCVQYKTYKKHGKKYKRCSKYSK
jgi:hypothetical protein